MTKEDLRNVFNQEYQTDDHITHLIGVIREAPPTLQLRRLAPVSHIRTLARSILQSHVVVVRDEQSLPRCAVASTVLHSERSAIDAKSRTELDAEVGTGDLDRGGAGVVDETLGLRVVAGGTAKEVDNVSPVATDFGRTLTQRGSRSLGCSRYQPASNVDCLPGRSM